MNAPLEPVWPAKPIVLLVDDNPALLNAGKAALTDGYQVLTAASADKMFELLERFAPKLILLDVDMPGTDGYTAILRLKQGRHAHIPVIFLSAMIDPDSELHGLDLGAVDYVQKPFSPALLKRRIETHLTIAHQREVLAGYNKNLLGQVAEQTQAISRLQNKLITALASVVESRDGATGLHIERTQRYLGVLLMQAIEAGRYPPVFPEEFDLIVQSTALHDIGKIAVPDAVLKKPGSLTPAEFEQIKEHVVCGLAIIDHLIDEEEEGLSAFLKYARVFIAGHHEKWDGSGYPAGLAGEEIPLLGRLMALADVYDALTSARPYKAAFSHAEAARIIEQGTGSHFDPQVVTLFSDCAQKFQQILVGEDDAPFLEMSRLFHARGGQSGPASG